MAAAPLSLSADDPAGSGPGDFESWSEIFDRKGGLTIVVQGSLFASNLVETALHCRHWRTLFPAAEIILSIGVTDIVTGRIGENRVLRDVELAAQRRQNALLQPALNEIASSCDAVLQSEGALPLPPIKFDTKINNINLQIAAARTGMARAGGAYTLRVRNDLVFHDREFLRFYFENHHAPRRARRAFRQRVLISHLFTLNPYTVERMPFHYSDWFHFGLTEDVRSIWDVEPMSLADATYYAVHAHAAHSNAYERRFRVRIADEQHMAFGALRKIFPGLRLAYHNDPTDAEESMKILLTDFIVCDLKRCNLLFDKYRKAMSDRSNTLSCITYDQWRDLSARSDEPVYRDHFAKNAERGRRQILLRTDPALRPIKYVIAGGGAVMRALKPFYLFGKRLVLRGGAKLAPTRLEDERFRAQPAGGGRSASPTSGKVPAKVA